jgi:hypothetical protein
MRYLDHPFSACSSLPYSPHNRVTRCKSFNNTYANVDYEKTTHNTINLTMPTSAGQKVNPLPHSTQPFFGPSRPVTLLTQHPGHQRPTRQPADPRSRRSRNIRLPRRRVSSLRRQLRCRQPLQAALRLDYNEHDRHVERHSPQCSRRCRSPRGPAKLERKRATECRSRPRRIRGRRPYLQHFCYGRRTWDRVYRWNGCACNGGICRVGDPAGESEAEGEEHL